ncbi:uncharacterized protein [Triticum aestivum]|uniref:uncharacterized protein n=1 Tax=Triticum aestivum TaxID=4565 RepID=UPI001D027CA2|nr:uncharacterized protein LOC123044819 [Triticum aestivum]
MCSCSSIRRDKQGEHQSRERERPSRFSLLLRSVGMESSNGKPPQGEEQGKGKAAGSIGGYQSLHRLLQSNLSPDLFKLWRPLSRPPDRDAIDRLLSDLRSLAFRLAPPLPPPPPEPD